MKLSLIMRFFTLISITAAPIEIKNCILMNTRSFSVVFAQQVSPQRYNAPQSGFTKIGCVLMKIQSILLRWLQLIPKILEINAKDCNQPNKKGMMCPPKDSNLSWEEKPFDLQGSNDQCSGNQAKKMKIVIGQTKKGRCAPHQKTATLQSRSC